jgi:hypothetical protein
LEFGAWYLVLTNKGLNNSLFFVIIKRGFVIFPTQPPFLFIGVAVPWHLTPYFPFVKRELEKKRAFKIIIIELWRLSKQSHS